MKDNIYLWISHPELLNKDTLYQLRSLMALYPYCQTIRALYLKNLYILGENDFIDELNKLSLYINDRKKLFDSLEGAKYSEFIVDLPSTESLNNPQDRTESLIDAFLSSKKEDVDKLKLSMEVSTDYTSFLIDKDQLSQKEGEDTSMTCQKEIDDFINEKSTQKEEGSDDVIEQKLREKDAEENGNEFVEDDDESYFTETLAKIYIKQKRYDKAMEIIKKLNLKYPKKNAYFADQIRFLEKLIINIKSK